MFSHTHPASSFAGEMHTTLLRRKMSQVLSFSVICAIFVP